MSPGGPRQKKTSRPARAAQGEVRKPYPVWLVTTAAFVLPGSGQLLNGNPIRGITMQFFMLFLGFITYQVTDPSISLIGRFSGGIFVYVFSVIDANSIARRRSAAWARMEAEGKNPARPPRTTQAASPPPARGGASSTGRPSKTQSTASRTPPGKGKPQKRNGGKRPQAPNGGKRPPGARPAPETGRARTKPERKAGPAGAEASGGQQRPARPPAGGPATSRPSVEPGVQTPPDQAEPEDTALQGRDASAPTRPDKPSGGSSAAP
jgi:hypothetical protein